MLRVHFVEAVPDQMMIVEAETAREGDLRTLGEHELGLGAVPRGEEIATVDHGRGQCPVADQRSCPGPPDTAGMGCEQLGCLIAEQLHGVAALDQGEAFSNESFEFNRADLGAVLDALTLLLRLLVGIEVALDAGNSPVEQADCRPEQGL